MAMIHTAPGYHLEDHDLWCLWLLWERKIFFCRGINDWKLITENEGHWRPLWQTSQPSSFPTKKKQSRQETIDKYFKTGIKAQKCSSSELMAFGGRGGWSRGRENWVLLRGLILKVWLCFNEYMGNINWI